MRLTTTTATATATALTLLSTLSDASPQGDRLGSKSITRAQTEALTSAIQEAHRTGVSVRSLLGDIFGGDDDQNAGFAPYNVTCPTDITWNRAANSIGSVEQEYLNTRAPLLQSAWQQRTSSLNLQNPGRTPVVAMSLSGGGYRAMVHGSGQAFLQNNTQGSAGDVLGLSTYVGGLSGGSWAISTWLANNGAQPDQLVRDVWNIDSNLIVPADNKVSFYYDLISEVGDKSDKGFRTQITDYWSLALSDHLFPEPYRTDQSPNLTITDVRSYSALANASLPYPVIIAVEREPGELVVPVNSTIWEFTLGEFGSWYWGAETKTQGGFTNIQYLGTAMDNGSPVASNDCVKGFSNLGFIAGTSSTLFNQGFLQLNESGSSGIITTAIESILGAIGSAYNDVAIYPNSFHNWQSDTNPIAGFQNLTLVDGGEANENVPFEPFLVPTRNVDAIIAMDNSADTTYSWPNGSSLWTSYQKGLSQAATYNISNYMPVVPSTTGFVNDGLNQRPVFFGCNETDKPIVVYLPNYPWSTYSNTSTLMLEYPVDQAAAIVQNGRRSLDLNGTVSDWPTCLTCALMDRAATENGTARSSECETCFQTWCWNGVDNTTERTQEYEPVLGVLPLLIQNITGQTTGSTPQTFSSGTGAGVRSTSAISYGSAILSGLVVAAGIVLA